jgi:hypothetical protein
MTKKLKSYKDLLAETERLEHLLDAQKELISLEIGEVSDKVFPAVNMVNAVGKFATYNSKAILLTTVSDILIDLIADGVGLKNKNWVGRIAIPGAMKNLSSHVIANNKDEIISLFTSFINSLTSTVEDENGEDCEEEGHSEAHPEANQEEPQ